MGGSDRADFLFLQGAQQLGLQVEREFANLIQKNRAALGGDQQSVLGAVGPGESALDVTEELALNQRGDQ
jgi:hypothetical protein